MMLKDKSILITGAASGIGRAMAELMAREGARLVLGDVSTEAGEAVAASLRAAGHEAVFQHCDVSQPEQCQTLVDLAMARYGRLDVACNNAGIVGAHAGVADMTVEQWRQVQSINLDGVFYGMKAQITAMLQSGGGSIINTSSVMGQVAITGSCGYAAAKHGVVGLTRCAALDYGTRGIRVNAIGPAFVHTPMTTDMAVYPEAMAQAKAAHALDRFAQPEEIAEMAVWLASDRASFVTGAYYPVDGGYLAR